MRNTCDEELLRIREGLERYLSGNGRLIEAKLDMIAELKQRMQEEVVHFVFGKIDGSERHAYGTRAADVIAGHDAGDISKGSQAARHVAFGTFAYFDIERQDWRCFRVDRLFDIMNDYTI